MLDYLDLQADLSGEDQMIRHTAREFVAEHVTPDVGTCFEDGEFPTELVTRMGELDFYGSNLDWGDLPNVSETAYGLVMQELEAGDSGVRSMASVQGALVMYPIHEYGSEAQRERWLPDLASGEAVGCFGLTEPEHGSDPASMETTAEPDDDGFRLTGTKTWITNAPIADVALVWARVARPERAPRDGERGAERPESSEDERSESSTKASGVAESSADDHRESADSRAVQPRDDEIRGFLVETDLNGVETPEIEGKLSMRVSETGQVHLQDAFVPAEAMLPGVSGMKGPLSCLTQARYGIAWGAVGIMRDCFETACEYATDREQFDHPIAATQLQQEKLAEMATKTTTSQTIAFRLAELKERGDLRPQQVSMAKRHNVRAAREVARTAREMLGGNGITTDYSPMRHLANVETVYTYEGTHDIHSLILGEDLTGFSAF